MGDTRTYEDFAGMLGRRVARVKEACGGAVGKKQYGGVQERTKTDEVLKAAIVKADSLAGDRSVDGQRRLWEHLSGYPEIAGRYGTNPDQNLDWIPEDWFRELADMGVDTTGVAAWRRKYTPERADSLARAAYGVKDGKVQTKGKGGNIMQYTVYFKDGGLLPKSQRRVYQTGGKASAQDMLAMLVQGAQILTSGKGTKKQQQQAQQMYIQMYQEALQGNQQYAQLIQAVFDGVQQGNQELVPVAQIFQEIAKQYQNKVSAAEFGGRLDYITMLRNGGRPRYQMEARQKGYENSKKAFGAIGTNLKNSGIYFNPFLSKEERNGQMAVNDYNFLKGSGYTEEELDDYLNGNRSKISLGKTYHGYASPYNMLGDLSDTFNKSRLTTEEFKNLLNSQANGATQGRSYQRGGWLR